MVERYHPENKKRIGRTSDIDRKLFLYAVGKESGFSGEKHEGHAGMGKNFCFSDSYRDS